jgi:hypothetical protein
VGSIPILAVQQSALKRDAASQSSQHEGEASAAQADPLTHIVVTLAVVPQAQAVRYPLLVLQARLAGRHKDAISVEYQAGSAPRHQGIKQGQVRVEQQRHRAV